MSKNESQSRRVRRAEHQAQKQRQRNLALGLGLVGLVVIVGLIFWTRQITGAIAARGIVTPVVSGEPIGADGKTWGPTDAPVVIQEYSDFKCSFCGQFAQTTGEQLKEVYGETGLVRFEYHHFPFLSTESVRAAEAAECANEQGAFWQYHDAIFLNQSSSFTDRLLTSMAGSIGLNESEFSRCLSAGKYRDIVQAEHAAGRALEVNSTPTFFINGEKVTGALPYTQFEAIIEAALAR
jgi:protein-disulfide isomerase